MDHQWRVSFRRSCRDEWQTQEFADRAAAKRFQRGKRNALWAAVLQWWHVGEQRWIG